MVHRKAKAPKTRARLIELKAKLGRKGTPDDDITAAFLEKYPEIARVENDDLIRIALNTMLNAICNLNIRPEGAQLDLFQGYKLPLTLTVIDHKRKKGPQKVKKNFDTTTKAEVVEYIERANRPPKKSKRTLEVIRFYEQNVRDYGDENSTMKQCWNAAQAHKAAS